MISIPIRFIRLDVKVGKWSIDGGIFKERIGRNHRRIIDETVKVSQWYGSTKKFDKNRFSSAECRLAYTSGYNWLGCKRNVVRVIPSTIILLMC